MIDVTTSETLAVRQDSDVIQLTGHVRQQAVSIGMGTLDQTKMSTASSELARNMLIHGGGGTVQVEQVSENLKKGIRLVFADNGPGIADVEQAMQSGYSTGAGMGLGLPGAKQLADEFVLNSVVGEGTTITIVKWAND